MVSLEFEFNFYLPRLASIFKWIFPHDFVQFQIHTEYKLNLNLLRDLSYVCSILVWSLLFCQSYFINDMLADFSRNFLAPNFLAPITVLTTRLGYQTNDGNCIVLECIVMTWLSIKNDLMIQILKTIFVWWLIYLYWHKNIYLVLYNMIIANESVMHGSIWTIIS